MTTAKDLLLAAGWKQLNGYYTNSERKVFVIRYPQSKPDDNLCDMLIRELSEEQIIRYDTIIYDVVGSVCSVDVLQATPEQKAQALMETYAQR